MTTRAHRTVLALALTLSSAVFVLPSLRQAEGSSESEGRAILSKVLDAHGGADLFRSFGTVRYHTDGLPYSAAAPLNFDHTADLVARHHRMEGESAKGTFVAAASETEAWTTDADALGIPPRWVNHGNSYFVLMPFVFSDPGTDVRDLGERTFEGKDYRAISVGYRRGVGDTSEDDYVLYIDPATYRLRLIDFSVTYGPMRGDTPIDELPRRSLEFVEWQETSGLLVPKTLHYAPWERTNDGGRRKEDGVRYTVSNIRFEEGRPDTNLFRPVPGATLEP